MLVKPNMSVGFCGCRTFRIGWITVSLNCREILMSSLFCTSSGRKNKQRVKSYFPLEVSEQIGVVDSVILPCVVVFLSPRLSASFLRLISSASCRSCKACWAMSSLATFDVIMKSASLHSMVLPLPSVRRPCEGNSSSFVNVHPPLLCQMINCVHTSSNSCSMMVRTSG